MVVEKIGGIHGGDHIGHMEVIIVDITTINLFTVKIIYFTF